MPQNIHLTDTVAASQQSVSCDLAGEVVVLQLTSGVYFGLNGVGCTAWQFIQEPRSVEDLITHLLGRYEVSREVCERQTLSLLEELASHELITLHPHAAIA